jgi:hypothetical protein
MDKVDLSKIMDENSKDILSELFYYRGEILTEVSNNLKIHITNSNTMKVYENRIKQLALSNHYPFNDDFRIMKYFMEEVNSNMNINSMQSICCNLLKFADISDKFKIDLGEKNIKFLKKSANVLLTQSKIQQQKKKPNDIEWSYLEELQYKLDDPNLDLSRDDKLLYKLYILPGIDLIPRNDFSNMKIVNTFTEAEDVSHNYYIIDAKKMIFNEYKTSGSGGQIVRGVPDDIINYINTKQKWLFEYREKRVVENTMAKKTHRIFNKLSGGKNITINTIRRAYASRVEKTDNIVNIIQDAENSMHSVSTHICYQTNQEPSTSASITSTA